ncbi:Acyl-CoA N-acyltransferase [Cordyceps fumosorosea ARSEF 2679]|uniref:Acyl-CoA N-acyltransferase n=1 Tax=Cordyceps fumosorosea (strain ARSEF 2679) TaxID=1081104 RepID=A0A167JTD5_CORFA|nr:Acyl-CoA N-acyltransferase [Cordyceps fumosorosea ARSEF 2679]OAA50727.1 Acyl-CoA N-acyltransferase [Cordyceps fumosorosea ARSEF 2679]
MDDFLHSDISTARLLLRPLVRAPEEDPIALERFHTLWSNEQATKWSLRGPSHTLEASKDWMAGTIPLPMPTNRIRIAYLVLYADDDEGFVHPTKIDEKHWKMAGVITLLASNFTLEGEVDAGGPRGPEDPFRAVELGYLFMPEVWGKGVATESVRGVVDAYRRDVEPARRPLCPREVQANVHVLNGASRRVLEKVGFTEVGRFEDMRACLPLVEGHPEARTILHFRMVG